jgi:hypothetical protein
VQKEVQVVVLESELEEVLVLGLASELGAALVQEQTLELELLYGKSLQ